MMSNILNDYIRLSGTVTGSQTLTTHLPKPTQDDYKNGYIDRYFIQKTNEKQSSIFEVNYKIFGNFSTKPEWTGVSVRWRLTGPSETIYNDKGEIEDISISESNRRVIELRKQKMPSLKKYLGNLTQFSKR